MLPEHVQALNKLFEEQDHKQKPILDDQQFIEIDAKLRQAKKNNITVEIEYFADHDYHRVKK
ncbi:YolD-like family protein [Virgibacillus sp. MG-45]|uniref:YolD-like family protein n=1 Tax=Virgibacillus sp. MG-45 TaxID=3102791 RepID=UPI002ED846A4